MSITEQRVRHSVLLGGLLALTIQKIGLLGEAELARLKDELRDSCARLGVAQEFEILHQLGTGHDDETYQVSTLVSLIESQISTASAPACGIWFRYSFDLSLTSTDLDTLRTLGQDLIDRLKSLGVDGTRAKAFVETTLENGLDIDSLLTIACGLYEDHEIVVLVVAANPDRDLDLEEEIRAISRAAEVASGGIRFEIMTAPAARPMDLIEMLGERRPTILHFAGHGSDTVLRFRDDGDRVVDVDGDTLVEVLSGRGVVLLVLNSCYSDRIADAALSSVEAVIGTKVAVDDSHARRFSEAFYRRLARGTTVVDAFEDAKDTVAMHGGSKVFRFRGDRHARVERLVRRGST